MADVMLSEFEQAADGRLFDVSKVPLDRSRAETLHRMQQFLLSLSGLAIQALDAGNRAQLACDIFTLGKTFPGLLDSSKMNKAYTTYAEELNASRLALETVAFNIARAMSLEGLTRVFIGGRSYESDGIRLSTTVDNEEFIFAYYVLPSDFEKKLPAADAPQEMWDELITNITPRAGFRTLT